MSRPTVSQRILIHLSLFSRFREEYECPPDVTQKGISSALGLSRSHVALELKRMVEKGHAVCRLAHVHGARSRRKVYFPSASGERMAAALRRRAVEAGARWIEPEGEVREGAGRELLHLCRSENIPMTPVYEAILSGEVVDLRRERAVEEVVGVVELVGRSAELEALRRWYTGGRRAIVILGIPGIGKTTLARAFLQEVEEAAWVEVYPFHSPASLLVSLARALKANGRGRLLSHLRSGPVDYGEVGLLLSGEATGLLLVFDDVSASQASEVLSLLMENPAPGCKLIFTAREMPGFLRESVHAGEVEELRLQGLDREEAASLVDSLGEKADPDSLYDLTRGHPLLLRALASDPSATWAEGVLLDQVLEGLSAEEESLLLQASVFRRPVPAAALPRSGVKALRGLMRRGLLAENGGRYEVHDVLRPILRLGAHQAEAHLRASEHWRSEGEWLEALFHLQEASRVDEAVDLALERLEEMLEGGHGDEILHMVEGQGSRSLYVRARALDYLGRWREALSTLEQCLSTADLETRVMALILEGRLLSKTGRFRDAEKAYEDAAALSEQMGSRLNMGRALYGLAIVQRKMGHMEGATGSLERALEIFQEEGSEREVGRARMEMGVLHLQVGSYHEAVEWFQKALQLLAPLREDSAYVYNNLGIAYTRMARQRRALQSFEESARMAEAAGMVRAQAYAMVNASDLYVDMGEVDRAKRYCKQSLDIFLRLGDPLMISACYANRAKAERAVGNLEEAEKLYRRSLEALEDTEAPYSLAARWLEISNLYEELGETQRAQEFRSRALKVLREEPRSPPTADA